MPPRWPEDAHFFVINFKHAVAVARHPTIRTYHAAADALATDPTAADLDLRFETIRMRLKARQRATKDLRPADVKTFHTLREAVLVNTLIDKRDRTL
jgi:hypothetical protein